MANESSSTTDPAAPRRRQDVDDVDLAILRALRDDARMTMTELASRVSVSRANVYARMARLRERGVIAGYHLRVDPKAVGLEVAALIFVSIEQGRWRDVRDRLVALPEVEFVGLAAGDFDFVVLVRTRSSDELRDVVLGRFAAMPEVRDTRTVFLLDEIDRPPVLPD